MSTNPNITAGSLDEVFPLPGRSRPRPSPEAVAALAACRKAKSAAYSASVETAGMPGRPTVTAARGEVQFVVHPRTLADWSRWKQTLGVTDVRGDSTGTAMVVRLTYAGVRARLVGYGVPALYAGQAAAKGGARA
ncbi:hypothetical protein [Streptomyces sp. C1-2]|uniref:hypothetical protein n=1 Tax=Streptomyces sp. C1-2 TaxID=2720022 RepID=UPI001432625D|nr:hypothetical protein [Streptomyces sp. C1-2]NJP71937.1 hypothetical protein [Streptomyces sp. C1-2]